MHTSVPKSMISMFWRVFKFGIFTLTRTKLMRMLRVRISSWRICSASASVPDPYAQGMHQFLIRISSWCVCSACFEGTELCAHISTWHVCSVHASVPDSYLIARIRSWHVCTAYTSVPDAHAQCMHQFLTRMLIRMLSMRVKNWCVWSGCASVPDLYDVSVRGKVGA